VCGAPTASPAPRPRCAARNSRRCRSSPKPRQKSTLTALVAPTGDTLEASVSARDAGPCSAPAVPDGDRAARQSDPRRVRGARRDSTHLLDERAKEDDLFPDRNGYSFGRWDGDKLIVETTHLKEAVDQTRYPHSDQAKIVEEYRLVTNDDGSKILVANMTMTDPAFYTQPITAEKKWAYLPGVRLLPYECNEPTWESHLEQLREQQGGTG
jgi:hypothetical protein